MRAMIGVEVGMQQRFAAADGDDGRAHFAEAVDAPEHFLERHRLGEIVEFVAVGAGEVAAADRDDVRPAAGAAWTPGPWRSF